MIYLRWEDGFQPQYQTALSSGADLLAKKQVHIAKGKIARVPTGVFIERVDTTGLAENLIPELQIRARSSLAWKHGITLANGIGTIDSDYRDEIQVLLINLGDQDFCIEKGQRFAQLVASTADRLKQCPIGGDRLGGFGSTGKHSHCASQPATH